MSKTAVVIIVILVAILGIGGAMAVKQNNKPKAVTNQPAANHEENHEASDANKPAANTPATNSDEVEIENFAFSPTKISVKKGTTVTWTNKDSVAHTVTSDEGHMLDSGLLDQGESFSMTFNEVGTFAYHCTPHPNMKASVVVTE